MAAIKEYPFDFSDIQNHKGPNHLDDKPPDKNNLPVNVMHKTDANLQSILCNGTERKVSKVSDKERKVSIMTDDKDKNGSTDRQNKRNEKFSFNSMRSGYLLCSSRQSRIKPPLFLPRRPKRRLRYTSANSTAHAEKENSDRLLKPSPTRLPLVESMTKPLILGRSLSSSGRVADRHPHIEGKYKKHSSTSTVYSKKACSQVSEQIERSWWYACCQKCHQDDTELPSWEPPHWQKVCPYPFCPPFRKFARILTICLIGLTVWVTVWMIMGRTAAPGGQLFTLIALALVAHIGGVLVLKITKLPALLGMLVTGIIMKNAGFVHFDKDYGVVVSFARKIALTILLVRAGMDLDPHAMRKHFLTVIKLSLVPWTFEFVLSSVLIHFLLDCPWSWSFLAGSVVAAVSPAVVVSCLLRLRRKGYGVTKGIPTLVLAVAGIDDAASVAVFGIIFSVMFSNTSLTMNIILGPLSAVVGIAVGVALGYFVKFVPEKNDAFVVPLRVSFLLFGGIVSMLGFEEIGWGGAGPLAVITFAFVAIKNWSDLGWELEDNPALTCFEILWMFFEPILFSVTGAEVVISELPAHLVLVGSAILIGCMVLRVLVTSASAVRSNLNMKEKLFVGLAWMAKATVQAALGPVALDQVHKMSENGKPPSPELLYYSEVIVTICILSIVITAPIGAIVFTVTGPRLLSKTTKPPVLEGWRRSNRPSIRDISIIDEEEIVEREAELAETQNGETDGNRAYLPPIVTQPVHQRS